MSWLYRYEAKRLQSWLLETNGLQEIKGGSQLICDLDDLFKKALCTFGRGEVESKAAAGGNAIFESESDAREWAHAWPMLVERWVPGLEIVQAVVEEPADAGSGKDAVGSFDKLAIEMRADRQYRGASLPEAGPLVFRAPRTERPALPHQKWRIEGQAPPSLEDVSTATRLCRARNPDSRNPDSSKPEVESIWTRLAGDWSDRFSPVGDLDRMNARYIAIVHADANDLGDRFQQLKSRRERKTLSNQVSEITRIAAQRAFYELVAWMDKQDSGDIDEGCFPLRPIVLGGDDLTVLTRGDLGIRYASLYLRAVDRLVREPERSAVLEHPIEVSAGVAIVHTHYPFHRAYDLAESLCQYAKAQLRQVGLHQSTPSALAFHRAGDSIIGAYEDVLEQELSVELHDGVAELAAGPYTLRPHEPHAHRLDDLERLRDALDSPYVPNGPIRQALGGITSPGAVEKLTRLRDVLLSRDAKSARAWQELEEAMGELGIRLGSENGSSKGVPSLFETPDPRGSQRPRTALLDALQWKRAEAESRRGANG